MNNLPVSCISNRTRTKQNKPREQQVLCIYEVVEDIVRSELHISIQLDRTT